VHDSYNAIVFIGAGGAKFIARPQPSMDLPAITMDLKDCRLDDLSTLPAQLLDAYKQTGVAQPRPKDLTLILLSEDEFPRWPVVDRESLPVHPQGTVLISRARPNLRAAWSAFASGALAASRAGVTVCNITMRDTITDVAVCHGGEVIDTASLSIGPKCMRFTPELVITEVTENGETFLDAVAKKIKAADLVDESMVNLISALLGEAVANLICRKKAPQVTQRLLSSDPLKHDYEIDKIFLAGTIVEYINNKAGEPRLIGHLGGYLADNVVASFAERNRTLELRSTTDLEEILIGATLQPIKLQDVSSGRQPIDYELNDCPVIALPENLPAGEHRRFIANRIEERMRRYQVQPGAPLVVSLAGTRNMGGIISQDHSTDPAEITNQLSEKLKNAREAIDAALFLKKPADVVVLITLDPVSFENSPTILRQLAAAMAVRRIDARIVYVQSHQVLKDGDYISWQKPAENAGYSAVLKRLILSGSL
jgi:hypothetical protein